MHITAIGLPFGSETILGRRGAAQDLNAFLVEKTQE
jgi:hypothetical protein